jgi:hypothetical protein
VEAILMRVVHVAALAVLLAPVAEAKGQAPAVRTEPATPVSSSRSFSAPVGLIINAVRADRVADFEKVLGYLQTALASSTNPTVRAQARGWRVMKASESGPNGAVLYVFVLDPAVAGADYGLGRILAEAYPDQAMLQEIWKLYTDSVASGGSLLNLTPVPGAGQQPAPGDDQPPAAGGRP